jgi:hypothetical protein
LAIKLIEHTDEGDLSNKIKLIVGKYPVRPSCIFANKIYYVRQNVLDQFMDLEAVLEELGSKQENTKKNEAFEHTIRCQFTEITWEHVIQYRQNNNRRS